MSFRRMLPVMLLGLACLANAGETRLGLYMMGAKIGRTTYSSRPETLDGRTLTRGDSHTLISASMLGSNMTIEMTTTSWTEAGGRPVRMTFVTKSGGRSQVVDARFGTTHADVSVETGGSKELKRLEIPKESPIVDDPLPIVLAGGPNIKRTFYVLRPDTVSFVKNEVVLRGAATATVGTRSIAATLVEVIDPMTTLRIFVNSKGDLVKAEGPLGIEMIPEDEDAEEEAPPKTRPDIAEASAIRADKPLRNPNALTRLTLRITGADLNGAPSDDHQTAMKDGDSWVLDIRPQRLDLTPGLTIPEAAAQCPEWTKPEVYIPSNTARFVTLSRQVVGSRKRVRDAALAIQQWVNGRMRPNPGIGVLRDAAEVLDSSEGVCRDAAILAATMCRAAGIPTRLASGLVSWDGPFYYHAWVEVWDGRRWLAIDPSSNDEQVSAAHVKLAGGNVEQAFRFRVLDKVSIKIERAESR